MENEINVKDYVRTHNGDIARVTFVGKYNDTEMIGTDRNIYTRLQIKKISKDVSDLVEYGDYVNGEKVTSTAIQYLIDCEKGERVRTVVIKCAYDQAHVKEFTEKDISTIITHEQYDKIKYNLKELSNNLGLNK